MREKEREGGGGGRGRGGSERGGERDVSVCERRYQCTVCI